MQANTPKPKRTALTPPAVNLYHLINKWQTRVLRLYAGKEGDPLIGDLLVADIVQLSGLVLRVEQILVEFHAISYAWGEPIFDQPLVINDQHTYITTSLFEALKCFRSVDEDHLLWADTVCIN